MAFKNVGPIKIENARIIFRHFDGVRSDTNRYGTRGFTVIIDDPEFAETLIKDGWNIKVYESESYGTEYQLPVEIKYGKYPPKIVRVGKTKTVVPESELASLNDARFSYIDLEISPYCWEVNGKGGIKAYLKSMYFRFDDSDGFSEKYADIPYDDEEPLPF